MKLLNQKFPTCTFIPLFLCIFLFPLRGQAHIIHVPAEYNTIQEAINASVSGDTVLVEDGFYQEQVNFLGKNIVLTSLFIYDLDSTHIYNTEINRDYLNEGVKFINGEGPAAQFIGFTISNCLWEAVYCLNSSPTIAHNIIKGNKAYGVSLNNSSAVISDNEIHCYPGFDLDGPYDAIAVNNSGPVIERNLIDGDDPNGNVYAINLGLSGYLPGLETDIHDNMIIGGIFGDFPVGTTPQLIPQNIFISGNDYTNAMNITQCSSNLKIYNNTLDCVDGIWIQGGNNPDIRNNVIVNANTGIELWVDSAMVAFNDVWNCNYNYSGIPDQTGKNGNISSDPAFRNPANHDFHFLCWSKCIDAGDPSSDYSEEPAPNGGRINMGSYGNTTEADLSDPCIRTFHDTIDFGYVAVNHHKDSNVFVVNAGHAQLVISSISNSNTNSFGNNYPSGTTRLNPNDTLLLTVTFHPLTNATHYSDSILISSNSDIAGKIELKGNTTLGISDDQSQQGFKLYPVPVTGEYLYIKPGTSWSRDLTINIFSNKGETIYSERIHPYGEQVIKINIGKLISGDYYVKINRGWSIYSEKFMVVRESE